MNSNIFDIIIIIFIISSILSLFSNKKEKNNPGTSSAPRNRQNENLDEDIDMSQYPRYNNSANNNEELIKEVESLFKTQTAQPEQPQQKQTIIESKQSSSGSENIIVEVETAKPPSDASQNNSSGTLVSKGIQKIDSQIERESARFEKLLAKQMDTENVILMGIKQRLRNPQSLKEFVAISEIIGKPKALSR